MIIVIGYLLAFVATLGSLLTLELRSLLPLRDCVKERFRNTPTPDVVARG